VIEIVDGLAQAGDDEAVKAVLVRLPETGLSPAAADEVRQAIRRLRAKGKIVIAHSQGFMPAGASVSAYMVGASASELWMQESASFQMAGLATEEIFFGRAFEKYGVNAQFEQRHEYKNAVNAYTQSDFTAAHREATLAWVGSIYDTSIAAAAADRKMTPAALKTVVEAGPWTAEEARARGLITHLGEVEQAEAEAKRRAGRGAEIVEFGDYVDAKGTREGTGSDAIAIVYAEGPIMTGTGRGGDPFGGGSSIMSDDTAEAIYDAIEDKSVKAIVLRVSSPGGSPEASEQIAAAVRAAQRAGKPVVVSMGAYAASGGYWISAEADWIVAQPATLTGSIGVFGGKFVLADALGRFGVDVRGLSVGGEFADAYAISEPWTAEQRAKISQQMDRIYDDFITRVARGRDLPPARVREIARGRVWTGAQALGLGLVDQLGGLEEAIAKARQLAKIPNDARIRLKALPGADCRRGRRCRKPSASRVRRRGPWSSSAAWRRTRRPRPWRVASRRTACGARAPSCWPTGRWAEAKRPGHRGVNGAFLDRSGRGDDIAKVEGRPMTQFDRLAALGPDARKGRGLMGPFTALFGVIAAAVAMTVGGGAGGVRRRRRGGDGRGRGAGPRAGAFALKARRAFGGRSRRATDPEIIEAKKVDGTWVAYGWDRR
jgi:protease-4